MAFLSKNVCIDKLDDIVNEYNNTYHKAIINSSKKINDEYPKFKCY